MKIMNILWVTAMMLAAYPAEADEPKKVQISGTIFTHFYKDLSSVEHANAFAVDRAYLTAKAKIDKRFSARITTDVGPLSNSEDSRLRPFLKYAYLEWKSSLPGMKLRLGMAGNGWTGYADKFWGHRYVSRTFSDRRQQLASANIGLHALGKHLHGKLTYQLSLVNGEGYDQAEDDDNKSGQLRLSYDLLRGSGRSLPISLFVTRQIGSTNEPLTQYAAALGFKAKPVTFWAEFFGSQTGTDSGQGSSVSLLPRLGKLGHLIVRFDQWDFSTANTADKGQTLLAGLGHNYGKTVSCALMLEQEAVNDDDPTQRVTLRLKAGF